MAKGLDNVTYGEFPRSESTASSTIVPALIERARVIDVNINDFTLTCRTEKSQKPKFDIPWMAPYCNRTQGEGINFMPEVGSTCWVCTPSETSQPVDDLSFVIGWTMPFEQGRYRGGRELLNPGDIHLSTRDQNFMVLRRGGIVQIGSTPICQRIFIPIRNIIQDFAENYEMHTPAGDLTWQVARAEDDGGGHQKCTFVLDAREFADDPLPDASHPPICRLKIGSHGDGDNTILTLLTTDKGGGSVQTSLTINKNGDVDWELSNGKFTLVSQDDMTITCHNHLNMTSDQDMTIGSNKATLSASGKTGVTIESGAAATVKAKAELNLSGAVVNLNDNAQWPVSRESPDMIAWRTAVTTVVNSVISGAAVLPVNHINVKVQT